MGERYTAGCLVLMGGGAAALALVGFAVAWWSAPGNGPALGPMALLAGFGFSSLLAGIAVFGCWPAAPWLLRVAALGTIWLAVSLFQVSRLHFVHPIPEVLCAFALGLLFLAQRIARRQRQEA